MSSVAFLNNTAGFGGGAMHLSNTMPITPGEPFVNITVAYNSVSAFAAGANIYGGVYCVIERLHLSLAPVAGVCCLLMQQQGSLVWASPIGST